MSGRPSISRTVQFWRLVDARDNSPVPEFDWNAFFSQKVTDRYSDAIDGRGHAGTIRAIKSSAWGEFSSRFDELDNVVDAGDDEEIATYGVVIAAEKDYVPNQEDTTSGNQEPMLLKGRQWEPVDNLFVWHLPFGNMIGVLAESVSSSRAAKYASWLSRYMRKECVKLHDPDFEWAAIPVVDSERAEKLKKAKGLKSAVFSGVIGDGAADVDALSVFFGPREPADAIRIEVKASLVRGRSGAADDEKILDWFTEAFGPIDGTVPAGLTKAQVVTSSSAGEAPTEIDLISHRLTRKRTVPLADETTRSITADTAFDAIIGAANLDAKDLYRLRVEKP